MNTVLNDLLPRKLWEYTIRILTYNITHIENNIRNQNNLFFCIKEYENIKEDMLKELLKKLN